MFVPQQPQYMYPGAQGGMVLIQPSGAMTTMPQGYPAAGQQAVYIPSSQVTFMQNLIRFIDALDFVLSASFLFLFVCFSFSSSGILQIFPRLVHVISFVPVFHIFCFFINLLFLYSCSLKCDIQQDNPSSIFKTTLNALQIFNNICHLLISRVPTLYTYDKYRHSV